MVKLVENDLSIDAYLALRETVGWAKVPREQAERAITGSLLTVRAVDETGRDLGMGRLVGDGAYICYIQDLVVRPDAQGIGVGSMLIHYLTEKAESMKIPGTTMMLCLMCAKGRESFYEKHAFTARPTDTLGPGMIRYLK